MDGLYLSGHPIGCWNCTHETEGSFSLHARDWGPVSIALHAGDWGPVAIARGWGPVTIVLHAGDWRPVSIALQAGACDFVLHAGDWMPVSTALQAGDWRSVSIALYAGDWRPVTIALNALSMGGKPRANPLSLHTMLEGPTEFEWMQDGCKVDRWKMVKTSWFGHKEWLEICAVFFS